jgi:NAD(P)H-flavin reductase
MPYPIILVAGMGPAGYTLSHYLLNEGFGVVGIDALKIEPLAEKYTGSKDSLPEPILDFNELYENLDKRIMLGFGGVAEYGITVRWDKNFLKVIYLTLARRQAFSCYGGVRFGGTLTIEDAWDLGFDHIAIASGAGKPTVIDIKNNLTRGIRKASDFLMALQLGGAAKASSLANLQVRLPAGVIGGGLTGTDTATELLAYYPVQVEKVLHRYENLLTIYPEDEVLNRYDAEEREILEEFLEHGRAIVAERQRAKQAGEDPDFQPLLKKWGGATMFYRKGLKDAPAYRQNHEEIVKAFEEGISWVEGMSPLEAIEDEHGHLKAVRFDKLVQQEGRWVSSNNEIEVPLKNLYVAAGTSPNTIYQEEHPDTFVMDGKFFQRYEPEWSNSQPKLVPTDDEWSPKIGKPAPLTSYQKNGNYISFFGDNHPVYAGNVVKAMASAKDGYPYVVKLFEQQLSTLDSAQQQRDQTLTALQKKLDDQLIAKIVEINRLTPNIIEVIVRAPMQAEKFFPGQFYRVQSYEAHAKIVQGTALATEGIALTGAWVDKEKGLISLIALEMGTSSRQCALWEKGDELVVMGVTGAATDIPSNKTVALVGGGLGNAVLFSIGKAMRAAGNKVIYFAGYKNNHDLFKVEDIEAASDVIIWSVDPGPDAKPFPCTRPQDHSFVGNILKAMEAYGKGDLGETSIPLQDVDHLIVIGSDRMMSAVKEARHGTLKPYLKNTHEAVGSINSPMQCMMKGICAQCMCKHIDPETGEEYFVYSCNNQDQDLDRVDFAHLNARLRQNTVQEKLSNQWLDYLLTEVEKVN